MKDRELKAERDRTKTKLVLLRSLVFGSVSGKFRSVVARFLFFEPTLERRWTTSLEPCQGSDLGNVITKHPSLSDLT